MNQNIPDGLPQEHVDGLLKSFFKKEMPDPWPDTDLSFSGGVIPRSSSWFGSLGRLALVASVALILLGYLALAAKFPVASDPGLNLNRQQTIGSKLDLKQTFPRPLKK